MFVIVFFYIIKNVSHGYFLRNRLFDYKIKHKNNILILLFFGSQKNQN